MHIHFCPDEFQALVAMYDYIVLLFRWVRRV